MHLQSATLHSNTFPHHDCFPFSVPLLANSPQLTFRRPITFFVGENGCGKTTLLEAIARKANMHFWMMPPRNHAVHANRYEARLHDYLSVEWVNGRVSGALFSAEHFFHFAEFIDDVAVADPGQLKYYGGQVLNTLSHGQGILAYFRGRFRVKGLYLLDEPEAALSPTSQVAFLKLLHQIEQSGHAQFIIATHSPILLAYPQAQIFSFEGEELAEVSYKETAHYQLYRAFLDDPAAFLKDL